jgi:hypothetical protein
VNTALKLSVERTANKGEDEMETERKPLWGGEGGCLSPGNAGLESLGSASLLHLKQFSPIGGDIVVSLALDPSPTFIYKP